VPGLSGWCWPSPTAASARSPAETRRSRGYISNCLTTYATTISQLIWERSNYQRRKWWTHGGNRGGDGRYSCCLSSCKGGLCNQTCIQSVSIIAVYKALIATRSSKEMEIFWGFVSKLSALFDECVRTSRATLGEGKLLVEGCTAHGRHDEISVGSGTE
jgi:hypothetical protein